MAAQKYSKQREAIRDYLAGTTSHPTADSVYLHVKQDFPNISLGTVYRNLNLLADTGEALKIDAPDGSAHFDGNTNPHYHVICKACGKIYDLFPDISQVNKVNEIANQYFEGSIESHSILFYGICEDCQKNKTD